MLQALEAKENADIKKQLVSLVDRINARKSGVCGQSVQLGALERQQAMD